MSKSFSVFFIFLFFALTAFAQTKTVGSGTNRDRPNIIFVLTDDQRFDALGAMGNRIIQTPNLDKLARAGLLFRNAYVTTSICCVSRASLLTGQYGSRHGIKDFVSNLSDQALRQTYPALLKSAGYKLGFIGKFGVGLKPPESLFDYWMNSEAGAKAQPDYITTGKDGRPVHDTDTIGHAISEFLTQFGTGEPFCLSVSFKAPHEQDGYPPKYIIQPKYAGYYRDTTIPSPLTADPRYWDQLPDFFRSDGNFGRSRWKGLFGTPELYQENVKNYYRLITGVDDVMGEMVAKLKALGISQKTVIIFMGDNGMFLGEHGMEGKWYGYEESIRVPMLIYDPLLAPNNHPDALQMALNIDIAPTILAMAGVPRPIEMQGRDLLAAPGTVAPRKEFFYQHTYLGSPHIPKEEGVVTKRFKYMKFIEHDYEELYDIKTDPHETTNLAKDARFSDTLNAMRREYDRLKAESF